VTQQNQTATGSPAISNRNSKLELLRQASPGGNSKPGGKAITRDGGTPSPRAFGWPRRRAAVIDWSGACGLCPDQRGNACSFPRTCLFVPQYELNRRPRMLPTDHVFFFKSSPRILEVGSTYLDNSESLFSTGRSQFLL